jgi:hypothetical protein
LLLCFQEKAVEKEKTDKTKRFERGEKKPMNRSAFWQFIERTKEDSHGDQEQQMTLLREQLVPLPLEELQSFDQIVDELRYESYRPLLWAAAYLINGGCSDDGFAYFRGWLITQGAAVFSQTVDNPDALADVIPSQQIDFECEEIQSLAQDIYHERAGEPMPLLKHLEYPSLTREELNLIENGKAVAQACPRYCQLDGVAKHGAKITS